MVGIIAYGGYIPRLRLERRAVAEANAWYAPNLAARAKGSRALANWDEDSLTMAVAAARDCLGPGEDRRHVGAVFLASCTLPFAERLNAGIVCEALTLAPETAATDIGGTQRAGLSALAQGLARVRAEGGHALVLGADERRATAASPQELDFGDGAGALLLGDGDVLAECLGAATVTADFVDHFREAGRETDYAWEERWIRDEGIGQLVPRAVTAALARAGVAAAAVDHFIFPTVFRKADEQVAARCGVPAAAVTDALLDRIGDTGTGHVLLLLAHVLERAKPGAVIVAAQFGSGAEAVVFRVTEAITSFRPVRGVAGWLARGVAERNYTKFLSFKGQLALERGMRGEQDRKTALTTAYRHRAAILGLVGGRCRETGRVHFPPSRLTQGQGGARLDTQEPYKLAERQGTVLSWSAEYLSFHRSPPHTYGQVDFDGGGRILMEFTDVAKGDIEAGTRVEMAFRIKDIDDLRGYTRYFWKAVPVQPLQPLERHAAE
ncbi:OB-fold domain-containing protein [Zavarzinia compransoris]|uniref:3-hydroxy-3-methylglutaryl CoA synthase n=1 Tax=Zavarzinia compransoris TaxID=1264899 RepID=A0A317E9I3_9PROT|nr:OB-fold domain-containing protein [Zavarzinia compransoris]PWR21993.1 3-hydroxy-3-methylglutaryl CoA synthase [Zavarzinia compransoris]TDP47268.1 3-hydroxy-3-methylglutaryl CoA synthase [Zavarzinia compransoris]